MGAGSTTAERTPRGQGERLRERLIDAALALLDGGVAPAAISIRGVTREAGVSPTAFYLHFDSRDELLRACVERGFTDFRVMVGAAAERGSDAEEQLINAGVAYIEFARAQPERYGLIFGSDWDDEDDDDDDLEVADAAFTDLVELIAAYNGSGSGEEQSAELDTLALGIWSGLHGFVTLCHAQPGLAAPSDREFATMLAAAWLGPPV